MSEKILLTIAEAAYKLNCSSSQISKLLNDGKLEYTKKKNQYLIHIDSIKAYAHNACKKPLHRIKKRRNFNKL